MGKDVIEKNHSRISLDSHSVRIAVRVILALSLIGLIAYFGLTPTSEDQNISDAVLYPKETAANIIQVPTEILEDIPDQNPTIDSTPQPPVHRVIITDDMKALGIKHMIAEYTTFHPCCQDRVHNIHLIADSVDGAIIYPGETFSLNSYVGERTEKKGYLSAPTIFEGEIKDTTGGGISQFTTTFYNAVFWAGIEDIDSFQHGFYFNRYPEGIEATISWPAPHFRFTNDYDTPIMIKADYTDTSITIGVYGDNDGRSIASAWKNKMNTETVFSEGGTQARRVTAKVSNRYDIKDEPEVLYRANPLVPIGNPKTIQSGGPGWSVDVTRSVSSPKKSFSQKYSVHYYTHPSVYEVHPCDMPQKNSTLCQMHTSQKEAPSLGN